MSDEKYTDPNTGALRNKLNIKDKNELRIAEAELSLARLVDIQRKNKAPGRFDFAHLKDIHKYLFQDIYEWAGQQRTVEIGKGNIFCLSSFIDAYAASVFSSFYPECSRAKNNKEKFVDVLAKNYADLNALHPFREGNGRTQREFTRQICEKCGYDFDLSCTTHEKMLAASVLSFNTGDYSKLKEIFKEAVTPLTREKEKDISIFTSDDIKIYEEWKREQESSRNDYIINGEKQSLSNDEFASAILSGQDVKVCESSNQDYSLDRDDLAK